MNLRTNLDLKEHYSKKWRGKGYNHPKIIGGINIRALYDYERKKRALEYLKPKKDEILLDAGCGNGCFTLRLSRKCKKVYGIDITKDSFILSRKKRFAKAIFKEMNLENIQFKNNYFDKIVCIDALEHTIHPEKVLRELFRVLKPRGILVLTYPLYNKTKIRKIESEIKIRKIRKDLEHITEWDFKKLLEKIREKRFSIIYFEGIGFDFGQIIGKIFEKYPKIAKIGIRVGLTLKKHPENSFWAIICATKKK